MINYHVTQHAQTRIQQRAINTSIIDYLIENGECIHDKHGCLIYYLPKKSKQEIIHTNGRCHSQSLHTKASRSFVVLESGNVITVGIRTKKIKRR